MAERERTEPLTLGDHLDAQLIRRIAGMVIMIASHQQAVQPSVPLAPSPQQPDRGRRLRLTGMQQVAKHHQPCRATGIDQRGESIQGGCGRPSRHRHAERTEGLGLAEMNVGHEQRARLGPPHRAIGEQLQRDTCHDDRKTAGGVGRGARGARGMRSASGASGMRGIQGIHGKRGYWGYWGYWLDRVDRRHRIGRKVYRAHRTDCIGARCVTFR